MENLEVATSIMQAIKRMGVDLGITLAIIAMSRSLTLEVVAEGVATSDQLDFLRKQGCDNIQVFLVSSPLPALELPASLNRYNRPGSYSTVCLCY